MNEDCLRHLDQLVAAPKNFLGEIRWQDEGRPSGTLFFVASIAINGSDSDGLKLNGRAASSGLINWISVTLRSDKIPVERFWYLPYGSHVNKSPSWSPIEIHKIRCPAGVNRRYAWSDNRTYPHDHRQEMARMVLNINLVDSKAALAYILTTMNISGEIPPPPYQATLGL